jgi:hypothetical protein
MRNNKDMWGFQDLPGRNKLSMSDVNYWKSILHKILKVGLEFEFNLPERKGGTCKGDSNSCPCINLSSSNDCWQVCANQNAGCTIKESECAGIDCPTFVPFCYVCAHYENNCSSCKFRFDPMKNPDAIRKKFHEKLKPNKTYGQVSKSGVHNITTDGSLLGQKGAEIITVGRRIDYWEFFKMSKEIIDLAVSRGAYLNERCSTHMHVLAGYFGKTVSNSESLSIPTKVEELERPLPEIVLANLHQLVRRYQNAMTWMMMGLNESERLTRWEKFRISVLNVSAVMQHMSDVRQVVHSQSNENKYGWINYDNTSFNNKGEVNRFHVEFRACDGLLSPSAIAAIACMYYALVIKAVEISRYGVVEIGDEAWLKRSQEIKEAMLNNNKSYQDGDRFSDTSRLYKYYDILIGESLDLVQQLKAILMKIGPAYDVLEKLAERPVALRRTDGETWEKIESDLQVKLNDEGKIELALSEIVTLNQITDCKDINEWVNVVEEILKGSPEIDLDGSGETLKSIIEDFVRRNEEVGQILWSTKIGAPIKL